MSECAQAIVDPGIATLSQVLDPMALAKHLRLSCLAAGNGGTVEEVQVRVLRHWEQRRCTLEIGMRTQNGRQSVIGKVYHNDRPDVFEAMDAIRQAGFGPQDEFSIPEPLAYLPALRLLLQEKVEGPLAKEIFKTGDEQSRAAAAERCARWLARFHARAPKAGPVFDSHRRAKTLQRYSSRVAKLSGRCADKAGRLLQRLEDAESSLSQVEMRSSHGSFNAGHVILGNGRTVVFDWDGYDVADPARDVGRFVATLRRVALGQLDSIRALDAAAEIFLKTYLAEGQPLAEKNLRFYEASACLKLAKSVNHWEERTEAMVDEGLRVLEQGAIR